MPLNNSMKIRAIVHPAEEGGYWAEVPALPGCITEGETMEEILANLKDAIAGWLEVANRRFTAAVKEGLDEIDRGQGISIESVEQMLVAWTAP